MWERDRELAWRVRDIIAVIADDIDAVTYEVEDGVVYIEGVVSDDRERWAICRAVRRLAGMSHVVICLSTERVLPGNPEQNVPLPSQVLMGYHSLS